VRDKVLVVGGVAVLSLAAFSLSNSKDRSTLPLGSDTEPLTAPEEAGELTCALPAELPSHLPHGKYRGEVEVFPAPIELGSTVVARALEGLRTFKLDRAAAARMVTDHLVTLEIERLVREHQTIDAARAAELTLTGGIPSRDTIFLQGVVDAYTEALILRNAGQAVDAERLVETLLAPF